MGFRVLLLTRYGRTGASSRLRFLQYLSGLDEYEIVVHPAPFLDDVYLKELYDGRRPSLGRVFAFYSERLHYLVKAREFDVVWIEKEVLPWVPGWMARTVLGGLPLVIDFDDDWHLSYSRSPNPRCAGPSARSSSAWPGAPISSSSPTSYCRVGGRR